MGTRNRFAGQDGYRNINGAGITFENDDRRLANVDHPVDARVAAAVEQAAAACGCTININSTVREPGQEPHTSGRSVDINSVNGIPVSDPRAHALVTQIANALLMQPEVEQVISPTVAVTVVRGQRVPITNRALLEQHNSHLHVGVRVRQQ